MNNQIDELQQTYTNVQQRIEKIQTEIGNYQQLSKERLSELGAIKMFVDS